MNLFIDNRSGVPIYEQIYQQIKEQIINESLKEDSALPSIRSLAKDLRISVITTKRAYDELERDGFVYTIPAKGCFVAARNTELIREENLKQIEEHISAIQSLAVSCRLRRQDILEMFDLIWEDSRDKHGKDI
ncbi:MAG: GntR family transcriptional regulator [Lachnospiraceae bacterium]